MKPISAQIRALPMKRNYTDLHQRFPVVPVASSQHRFKTFTKRSLLLVVHTSRSRPDEFRRGASDGVQFSRTRGSAKHTCLH